MLVFKQMASRGLKVALAVIALCGCTGNIYLHDKQLAAYGTDASANFAKIDYTAIFDREHKITDDLLQRRGVAVAKNSVALRNYNASILITESVDSIKNTIRADLNRVTGKTGISETEFNYLTTLPTKLNDYEDGLKARLTELQLASDQSREVLQADLLKYEIKDPVHGIEKFAFGGFIKEVMDEIKSLKEGKKKSLADQLLIQAKIKELTPTTDSQAELTQIGSSFADSLAGVSSAAKTIGYTWLSQQLLTIETAELQPALPPTTAQQPAEPTKPDATLIFSALKLGTDATKAYDSQNHLSRLYSIQIAQAVANHQLSVARQEANVEDDKMVIRMAEILDLSSAAKYLIKARDSSDRNSVLSSWRIAQDIGIIPYRIHDDKLYFVERNHAINLAAETSKGYQELITTSLKAIDDYGKGGVPPETIAHTLADIGLIAAFAGAR